MSAHETILCTVNTTLISIPYYLAIIKLSRIIVSIRCLQLNDRADQVSADKVQTIKIVWGRIGKYFKSIRFGSIGEMNIQSR